MWVVLFLQITKSRANNRRVRYFNASPLHAPHSTLCTYQYMGGGGGGDIALASPHLTPPHINIYLSVTFPLSVSLCSNTPNHTPLLSLNRPNNFFFCLFVMFVSRYLWLFVCFFPSVFVFCLLVRRKEAVLIATHNHSTD